MTMPLTLLVALGCAGSAESTPDPTGSVGDTGPDCTADMRITHAEGGCLGAPDTWEYKADLKGCAESAVLHVWRTDGEPAHEEHLMGLQGEGPARVWQAYYLALTHGAPTDGWEPGATSSFDCAADAGRLTWAVQMLDAGGQPLTCAAWGHAPADVPLTGCAVEDAW